MKKPSPRTQLILGLAVSLVFLALAFRGVSFGKMLESFQNAQWSWSLPAFLGTLALSLWVRAYRWTVILQPLGDYKTKEAFPFLLIGLMGNNIYPAHLGEFLRAYAFARHKKLPFSTVFSTLVVERIFDLLAVLGFFYAGFFTLSDTQLPPEVSKAALGMASITLIAILGVLAFVVAPDKSLALSRFFLKILPEGLAAKLDELITSGVEGLKVVRSPLLLLNCLACSLVLWSLLGLLVVISLAAFGVQVKLAQAFFLQGLIAIAVTIPSSPGFFGVVQYAFSEGMALFRIDRSVSNAASWYYHLVQYVPVTLTGLYFLKLLGIDVSEVQEAKAAAEVSEAAEAVEVGDSPQEVSE